MKVRYFFRKTFYAGRENEFTISILVDEVSYQRNGVTGEGFHQVLFRHDGKTLIAVQFDVDEKRSFTAVVDPFDFDSHYRGDNFAELISNAIETWRATQ